MEGNELSLMNFSLGGMERNGLSSINFSLKLLKDSHTFSILAFNFKIGI